MKRVHWFAVASTALALSCGGTQAPSPAPSVAAGAGYLRCDQNGIPFIGQAWARLDVHAGNRDLALHVVRARYLVDGNDVYEAVVSRPDATVDAGTDITVYFDVAFRDAVTFATAPKSYAIALDLEAGGRTWSVQSPSQVPNCGP